MRTRNNCHNNESINEDLKLSGLPPVVGESLECAAALIPRRFEHAGDARGSADYVFKLRSLHGGGSHLDALDHDRAVEAHRFQLRERRLEIHLAGAELGHHFALHAS